MHDSPAVSSRLAFLRKIERTARLGSSEKLEGLLQLPVEASHRRRTCDIVQMPFDLIQQREALLKSQRRNFRGRRQIRDMKTGLGRIARQ